MSALVAAAHAYELLARGRSRAERERIARDVMATLLHAERRPVRQEVAR